MAGAARKCTQKCEPIAAEKLGFKLTCGDRLIPRLVELPLHRNRRRDYISGGGGNTRQNIASPKRIRVAGSAPDRDEGGSMSGEIKIKDGIFGTDAENYSQRVPCVVVMDCSYSMEGRPIEVSQ